MGEKEAKQAGERRCTYCKAKENEVRLVGNFTVELTGFDLNGAEKLACQSCKVKVKEAREAIQKNIGF